jgi:DNA-binding MarR family transcriptional regulator
MAESGKPNITYLLKWVERGVRRELDAALRPLGITTPEYTALSVLRQRAGLSSAQLARRAFVSDQAMNQIVISLERRGWIERAADPSHGRILRAKLTRSGSELLRACDPAAARVEGALLEGLSAVEVRALRKALESCATSLTAGANLQREGERA